MLENFRTNLRGLALGITIVIAVIFALSGTGTLFLETPGSETALVVNGEKISERDFQIAMAAEKNRILGQNPDLDQALLDDQQIRPLTVQRLVSRKVLAQSAKDQDFAVSAKLINEIIMGVEQFQTDGKFDQDKFRFSTRNQGYASSADFMNMLRGDLLVQQFSVGILNSSFVTESELSALATVTEQKRDFYYTKLPIKPLKDQAKVTEQAIADRYQLTSDQYVTQRQVAVQYIELNPQMLMGSQQVTEEQIQARFDLEAESADIDSSRRAAHILLEDAADSLIAELQEKIDAGINFADLAKQYSNDFATANNGGDLGFTTGETFPEAFEAALAVLEIGQVSAPISTEAGVHFIKLLEIQESTFLLDEQRQRITEDLRRELAEDLLVAKLEQLKELSFNAENLDEVAQELDLSALVTEPFPVTGGSGIAALPAVVKAAYSPEVLEDGYASEVLDLGNDRYIVIKLQEDIAARQLTLEEVSSQVKDSLVASVAQKQLEAQGETLLQRITSGESVEDVANSLGLDWQVVKDSKRGDLSADSQVNAFAFELPSTRQEPVVDSFYAANGDFVVLKLTQVTLGDYGAMGAQEKNMLRSIVEPTYSGREILAYQATLINQADVVL